MDEVDYPVGMPTEEFEETLPSFWPSHLKKAAGDYWQYALKLRDGSVIEFTECRPQCGGEWVLLIEAKFAAGFPELKHGLNLDRGFEVRFSEIVWVIDAPYGS